MTNVNFLLTPDEMTLVQNRDWLLTKQRIISKVYALFGDLSDDYRTIAGRVDSFLPEEALVPSPKIYRGEQYLQLPYVMLDYPRLFDKMNSFAIRSLFWWGNHFSIHLLLSGKYKDAFAANTLAALGHGWYVGVNADPWQHHFGPDNYQPIAKNEVDFDRPYFKAGAMHPLDRWESAKAFYLRSFEELLLPSARTITPASMPPNV